MLSGVDFDTVVAPHRQELLAHCQRVTGRSRTPRTRCLRRSGGCGRRDPAVLEKAPLAPMSS
jgi:hypothetical protein